MQYPKIDETKIETVSEIIEKINDLAVNEDCDQDSPELMDLASELRNVTGNEALSIEPFMYYDSYTTLEDAVIRALLPVPKKTGLSDEEIKEIIRKLANTEILISNGEAMEDYFLKVLEVETGLDNITDYIYNPNEVGMELHASIEEIIERIMADRN